VAVNEFKYGKIERGEGQTMIHLTDDLVPDHVCTVSDTTTSAEDLFRRFRRRPSWGRLAAGRPWCVTDAAPDAAAHEHG
jgi:hypothetical protein